MNDMQSQVLEALRHYAVSYNESAHHFARWMDLPFSDGAALGEILWAENEGKPLSPARLASRIGMTSGAANALVNRLEGRGLVRRSRESPDRRIVTLRVTETARERSAPFLEGSARELQAALGAYDRAELEAIRAFLERFAAVLPRTAEGRVPGQQQDQEPAHEMDRAPD